METPSRYCTYLDSHLREHCSECGLMLDSCQCQNLNDNAHTRLWSDDGQMIRAIRGELQQAREAFPHTRYMLTALMEEVGELAQALMEHSRGENKTAAEVFHEAIQVATMAIRIGTEGDSDFSYESFVIFGEESSTN